MEHGRQSQRRPRTTGIRTIPINCFPAYTQRKHRHARTDTRTHTRAHKHTHTHAHIHAGATVVLAAQRAALCCAPAPPVALSCGPRGALAQETTHRRQTPLANPPPCIPAAGWPKRAVEGHVRFAGTVQGEVWEAAVRRPWLAWVLRPPRCPLRHRAATTRTRPTPPC